MLALILAGCTRTAAPLQPIVAPVSDGMHVQSQPSLAWQVERRDAVSWVVGTCARPTVLEERVEPQWIAESRAVFVEADLAGAAPSELLRQLWEPERSNSADLGREGFAQLARLLHDSGSPSMVEHLPPWAVDLLLELQAGFDPDLFDPLLGSSRPSAGLDAQIIAFARSAEVPVRQLETVEEHLALRKAQPHDLSEMIRGAAREHAVTTAIEDACAAQDPEALEVSLGAGDPFRTAQVSAWLPTLLAELRAGEVLVAVDVRGLLGDEGLLARLRAEGFRVRPVERIAPRRSMPTSLAWEAPADAVMDQTLRDLIGVTTASVLCQEEQLVRECFFADAADACSARVAADVELCVDGYFSEPSALEAASTTDRQAFNACTLAGLLGDAAVRGFPDSPACLPLHAALGEAP